jgi:C4-dicarboxylate transporter DctQ subunit
MKMSFLQKSGRLFDRLIDFATVLAGIMIIFLMLSVSMEVVLRYFWGRPISWVDEIAGYILLYIPFLIAAWVLRREGHVTMDLLTDRLNPGPRYLLNFVTSLISAAICIVLTWFGWRSSLYFVRVHYQTPTVLMLPKGVLSGIIFVGFFLLAVQFLRRAHRFWKDWTLLRFQDKRGRGLQP